MKTRMKILGMSVVEPKEDKKGYTKFETSEGKINIFNKDIVEKLQKNIGKEISIGVEMKGEWKNIRSLELFEEHSDTTIDGSAIASVETVKASAKPFEKDPVGLAMGLFPVILSDHIKNDNITDYDDIMAICIRITKIAIEGFK